MEEENIEQAINELWQDYLALIENYKDKLPGYEIGYALIRFSTRMLMDIAPTHQLASETIEAAIEQGIKWHMQEKMELLCAEKLKPLFEHKKKANNE